MGKNKIDILQNWIEEIVDNRVKVIDKKLSVLNDNDNDNDNIIYNSIVKIITTNIELNPLIPSQITNSGQGIGTGFFFDEDFNILTAAHVVKNATKLVINIPEHGKILFPAKIVCVYNDFDLAIIRLDIDNIEQNILNKISINPLTLGDSEAMRLGDQVYALGYPDNSEYPMRTTGTISGRRDDYIQSDTAINGGNSGGPLMNMANMVIGINSAVLAGSEDSSLVIPIKSFITVRDNMLQSGNSKIIHKNVLGVLLVNGNMLYSKYNNISENIEGQIVKSVLPKSPVLDVLNVGDIILKINDYNIDDFGEISVGWEKGKVPFDYIIKRSQQNSTINLTFYNLEKRIEQTKPVKLKSFSEIYPIREIFTHVEKLDYECFGGIVVMDLNLDHITQHFQHLMHLILNEEIYTEQLIISHIFDDSSISKQQTLFPGMLITEVNGISVSDLKGYRNAIKKVGDTGIINIQTRNARAFINTKTIYDEDLGLSELWRFPLSKLDTYFK